MNITTKVTHVVTFTVEVFVETEGGMDHDTFGKPCDQLADAITLLQIANASNSKPEWVIVARVKTTTTT